LITIVEAVVHLRTACRRWLQVVSPQFAEIVSI